MLIFRERDSETLIYVNNIYRKGLKVFVKFWLFTKNFQHNVLTEQQNERSGILL